MSSHAVHTVAVRSPQDQLGDRLNSAEDVWGRCFIPADEIRSLLHLPSFKQVLDGLPEECQEPARTTSLKTLLILVIICEENLFPHFLEQGFSDDALPIRWTGSEVQTHEDGADAEAGQFRSWEVFERMRNISKSSFALYQWYFLCPQLEQTRFRQHWSLDRPLPILGKMGRPKKGGWSEVHQVKVHPAHVDADYLRQLGYGHENVSQPILVAVKIFRADASDSAYKYELKAWTEIKDQGLRHRHLCDCIAAIERDSQVLLVLPWAAGGNLRDHWKGTPPPTGISDPEHCFEIVKWALQQMSGICDGLGFLAKHNCRHGDLKPDNLLRMCDSHGDRFVIADVGFSKFHVITTTERQERDDFTTKKPSTSRYCAPEVYSKRSVNIYGKGDSISAVSRDFDVWSMGVILLGWVTWLASPRQHGQGLRGELWEFQRDSQEAAQALKLEAQGWMDDMVNLTTEGTAIGGIARLILSSLIVVRLRLKDGPPPERGIRTTAEDLAKQMKSICSTESRGRCYVMGPEVWGEA